ncbi:unnamed protein product (macronuclear) [Paramecium tetraurelia]|uniref:U2A'/phosphoprotein 32 family A C-terminal domain-containing protein n=1 Tax=Paramecium tetraurelia TaxID=5888 RepID=A0BHQ6_PARTE|nr:uncharacterized protein GSPATT00029109001 [Paramecium tetraurelia]CAK58073.1 unnamed protein product [Paramecium tetraurelia]|eukprot:XP_001425471.1 hypothetical protein (macronuclear) [Paramecium tetraurelia strain d4-2]
MSWQQKLKKQIGTQPYSEIKQLRFNNLQLNKLPEDFVSELHKCTNLEILSLNQCGIRSLENLQQMCSVTQLEYLDNFTTSKTLQQIAKTFPNLEVLIAGGNFLRELRDLDALKPLTKLETLNIMNGINKPDSDIRKYAFEILPRLKLLDEKDKYGQIYVEPKQEKKQFEVETQINMEQEEVSQEDEESALCSDDSNEEEESDSDDEEDSDLSDFIEKKVKNE